MKKTIISTILTAAVLLTACGCENGGGEAAATTTTAETTTTTTAETTTATTTEAAATTTVTTTAEATTTEAVTTTTEEETTEAVPEVGGDTDLESIERVGTGLIQNAKKGDGFVTNDRSAISEDLAASGMNEKKLTAEAVKTDNELLGNNTENVYTFAMISTDGVQEYPSGDTSVFMSMLLLNNEAYSVYFGTSDTVTYEEVSPYCTAGKYIEYWAFATVSDKGNLILMPFIAGSEENGYYLVQPIMKLLNVDISDMTLPEPVGDEYNLNGSGTEYTPSESSEGSAVLNITGIENYDGFTCAAVTMENKYDVPLYFVSKSILVNGTEYSDTFTAFFEVKAGETTEDFLYVDGVNLTAGDNLEITFSLQNAETYEDFGEITFKMTLESIAAAA